MKAFTIDTDNNITAHASISAARKQKGAEVFSSEDALGELAASWATGRLVAVWNTLTGVTPVKKFKDRATAVTRIWGAIQSLEGTLTPHDMQEDETPSCTKAAEALTGTARTGSKRAEVLELMRRPDGITLEEIMTLTGWQKHTVRGFISGALVKKGVGVESFKTPTGARAYRVLA